MWNHIVVSYSVPISNHNCDQLSDKALKLYLILFLYQTTTFSFFLNLIQRLYLILFLYQTTTTIIYTTFLQKLYLILFLYQTTTKPASF